jgi:hypothetical protein
MMPTIWIEALLAYRYPAILSNFENARKYPGWFNFDLTIGDRTNTIEFEDHFRRHAPEAIEPWLEVVFWKLFSQPTRRNTTTRRVALHFQTYEISPKSLWHACNNYIENPTRKNFESFRILFGFVSKAIAIVATFPAFVIPNSYPMVDTRIAKWVGDCMPLHNAADPIGPQLTRPRFLDVPQTVLMMDDFGFMETWTHWCRHTAHKLSKYTSIAWRARDVEMAVFHSWGERNDPHPKLILNPLINLGWN